MIDYTPTAMELMFWQALALIIAACFFAPLAKKYHLGSILGYLIAGVSVNLLFAGNFSKHPEELLHFSEFGVVLFLFVIGLELNPRSLWRMRADIFGLGSAQMLSCGAILAGGAVLAGFAAAPATIIGLGLALSSTAIVMAQLDERHDRSTEYGRKAFGILLLQDLVIVPLLLLVSILAPVSSGFDVATIAWDISMALTAILILILIGRFLLDKLFTLLVQTRVPEIMTAAALGFVIASALLMDMVGMSYAMGSFLAGVMLAESTYRHEVEANIEPFRGLFLGLFFMAVGLSLDLQIVSDSWYIILVAVPITMFLKCVAIYGIARIFSNGHNTAIKIALALPQHGEFGFVLFASAAAIGLLPEEASSLLIAIVAVSMTLSSLTSRLEPLFISQATETTVDENYSDANGKVLIIGFGRFGQIVSQPLLANGIDITILDYNTGRIKESAVFGFRVYYGDGRRRDILRNAGVKGVDAVMVCTDEPETTNQIVRIVKFENPQAKIYVRVYDRLHFIHLYEMEPNYSVREVFESALLLSKQALIGLGTNESQADDIITDIRSRDLKRLKQQASEGVFAGKDQLHTKPVKPEPL